MKITVANKKLSAKPQGDQEKRDYFNGLVLSTKEIEIGQLKEIVSDGITISYVYRDQEFSRRSGYMKDNYVGTQFIVVDIDKCDKSPDDFVLSIKYRPTVFHTTFSNLTESKDNKYCFHLIYIFNEMIFGEDNYTRVFSELTSDYFGYVDKQAKDPHRMFFTSNSDLEGFEYVFTDVFYDLNEFKSLNNVTFDSKSVSTYKLYTPYNLSVEVKNESGAERGGFMTDFNTMKRSEFIEKYSGQYPMLTSTPVEFNENGYADVSGREYYELESMFRFDPVEKKMVHEKVKNGKRTSTMYARACKLAKIIPDVTLEWLIAAVTRDVYENYDNSDRELTNKKIYSICKEVYENRDSIKVKQSDKKMRIDTGYWAKKDCTPIKAVGICRRLNNEEKIMSIYDFSMSIEDNLKVLEETGVKTTKRYVKSLLEKNGCEVMTEKDIIREKVFELDNEGKTTREIAAELGISQPTVSRILKNR